jgi:pimeloyl-ACP methyl ester carboxylesterase
MSVAVIDQDAWIGLKRLQPLGNGSTAFVDLDGVGPALVLVHGFTDTSRSYSLLAPHLAGRRLLIPDLRGHGLSAGADADGLADYAADLIALIEARGLHRPILVGHSLGGMAAIQACFERPDLFSGLVVVASSPRPEIGADHPIAAGVAALRDPIQPSDPFYAYWHDCRSGVPAPFLEKVAEEASMMPAYRWRSILDMVRGIDLRATASLVDVRALIVNGADDPLFGPEHRAALAAALPHATVADLPGCGHNPHWEEPAAVAEAIGRHFPASANL